MNSPNDSDSRPWYLSSRFHVAASWIFVVIVVVEGYCAIVVKDTDFEWHRKKGVEFLQGGLHRNHYAPSRIFMDAALALVPYRVSKAIVYSLALVLLAACGFLWERMAARFSPATQAAARSTGCFALILFLPYLLRDLDECGLQILLLFLMTMAGDALLRGKGVQTGFWLGTAISFKMTPLLGLPFLLWKREWKAALSTGVVMLLWAAAPSLYLGWENNLRANREWIQESQRIQSAKQAYPSLLDREPQKIFNLSLQAAIARCLETYPPGHPLFIEHPLFFQAGNLSPESAHRALQAILLMLGLAYAWKIRVPWGQERGVGAFPGEWATLCAFCALLSPLCWKHHLVTALPLAFLVIRATLTTSSPGRLRVALLCALGAVVYGCREFIAGKEMAAVLLSCKFDTWAVSALLVWTLCLPRRLPIVQKLVVPQEKETLRLAA